MADGRAGSSTDEPAVDIAVDASFLAPGSVGGAEHMLKNLVRGLLDTSADLRLAIVTREGPWLADDGGRVTWRCLQPGRNRFLAGTTGLRDLRARSILCPNYFTPPGLSTRAGRVVTVIHDLQYRHFPQFFSRRKRLWLRAAHRHTLRRADRVVAISEFVAADIAGCYGERWRPKLTVIPDPVSWARFDANGAHGELPAATRRIVDSRPFVLTVAANYPHKNLERLVQAMSIVRRTPRFRDVALVVAGQLARGLVGTLKGRAELPSSEWVVPTGYISDAALGALYRRATAFAFPSLFEGFGMPAVEALGFGLPVVASRTTAIPESTRGLACLLDDPTDTARMAATITEILEEPERWAPAAADVADLRRAYDPSTVARRYLQVLLA
ncbi:MAG TPA: glycosyltransferase family 1 protein [Gaiellaceae bacterium]|jgi:glycosyltransferase involved in cell wall biosynthesis